MDSHPNSLQAILAQAEATLRQGPHPERARLDAETLLLRLLRQNRAWLMAHDDEHLPSEIATRYHELLARRLVGEPIQYILGHAEFYGLPFLVTPAVLIPRPETEHLVEELLRLASAFPNPRIADIGTGSGAIAIALAHHLPHASLTATDISSAALAVARQNAEHNNVADRIRFLQGDLLASPTSPAHQAFHLIASNPPYVPEPDLASLSVEVRDHEPHSALFAGQDGLAIYRSLIPAAFQAIVPGGRLALEIGYGQQTAVQALLAQSGFANLNSIHDYQGIARVLTAQRPKP